MGKKQIGNQKSEIGNLQSALGEWVEQILPSAGQFVEYMYPTLFGRYDVETKISRPSPRSRAAGVIIVFGPTGIFSPF